MYAYVLPMHHKLFAVFFPQEYIYFYCLFAVILCIIPHSIHSIA